MARVIEQVQALYRLMPEMAGGRSFEQDLALHVQHGYVWSSPRAIVMARLVHSSWPFADFADLTRTAPESDADTWFVYLAAGDLAEFFRVMPFAKDFVCFYRRRSPRFHLLEPLQRRCLSISSSRNRPALAVTSPANLL